MWNRFSSLVSYILIVSSPRSLSLSHTQVPGDSRRRRPAAHAGRPPRLPPQEARSSCDAGQGLVPEVERPARTSRGERRRRPFERGCEREGHDRRARTPRKRTLSHHARGERDEIWKQRPRD